MMESIQGPLINTVVSFVAGGLLTAFVGYVKKVHGDKQEEEVREDAIEQGVMWLLRADLIRRCDDLIGDERVSMEEWTSLQKEHGIYHKCGGNGALDSRMELLEHKVMHDLEGGKQNGYYND